MKRRLFIKKGILSLVGASTIPTILTARDCDITASDILGPYWSDNHPNRTVLANINEPGTRIIISGYITANDCETPIENALIDVWHANNDGCYTLFQECESGNPNQDPYNLRGIIVSNSNGYYSFESIWPGYYAGRPRHFHYKVTTPSGQELVTQCYFEIDPNVNEEWEENHSGLVIPLMETINGLVGEFNITINEAPSTVNIVKKPYLLTTRVTLDPAFPNPFNNSTQINFTIENSGYVNIDIYDINGQWVTNLINKRMHVGTHQLHWKGLNMNGFKVSSGSYLILMKFRGTVTTNKIELVK